MMLRNTTDRYGNVAKFFHWFIAVLIICMLIYGYFLENVPEQYKSVAYNIHKLLGLFILIVILLRLLWSLANLRPLLPEATSRWQRRTEQVIHYLLYLSMLLMPLSGWIGSSASGKPPGIGDLTLAFPIEQSKEIAGFAFMIHNNVALLLIGLITVHVLAAFYHHFIKRDNVLIRMLPR